MHHIEYMKEIGARGGRKRATHPRRKALARRAARKRWEKRPPKIITKRALLCKAAV